MASLPATTSLPTDFAIRLAATWRDADGQHYGVGVGPTVDNLFKALPGVSYGWSGSDEDMSVNAIYTWQDPPVVPVNLAFVQDSSFNGSGFPASKSGHLFVTQSGPTYATGAQTNSKSITEIVLDGSGNLASGPTDFVKYNGSGKATAVGLAAGPDGLYFTDLYKDLDYLSPIDTGANVLRIQFVGNVDFTTSDRIGSVPLPSVLRTSLTYPGRAHGCGISAMEQQAHFKTHCTRTRLMALRRESNRDRTEWCCDGCQEGL